LNQGKKQFKNKIIMNYGIEFEYFVENIKTKNIVPAYKLTSNVDGDPVIGEIKTDVFKSFIDTMFDLKKKIYEENQSLLKKGYKISKQNTYTFGKDVLLSLRKDPKYINSKHLEILEEYSIYNKSCSKILPRGVKKASLQINISNNSKLVNRYIDKRNNDQKFINNISEIFNYPKIIKMLDDKFVKQITESKRVKGVYAIKNGLKGKRIEYRSLPNSVCFDDLLSIKF
jgi:hypothetical protein